MALDQAKLEGLTKKIGGRFKLTSLLQKRLCALMRTRRQGTRIPNTAELLDMAVKEIAEGKIILQLDSDKTASKASSVLMAGDADEEEE